MNRTAYFNYIEEKLQALAARISTRGKLNMLELHLHSENFYLHFFNALYGYKLENLNSKLQNVEAIDLIDHTNKLIVQVSSTCSKQKIESALSKDSLKRYPDYCFRFISISRDASDLRKKNFLNPNSIKFDPLEDIFDITSVLNSILTETILNQQKIYNLIKDELGNYVDIVKLDSNLAAVINVLSKEAWDDANKSELGNQFQIEQKITYNDLSASKPIIDEYCVYYKRIEEKYSEFDALGVNKSKSVLASIRREYIKLKDKDTADNIFSSVIESVKNKVLESANFTVIPIDELELCVDILVVDAFIRCKIFENPNQS